MKRFLYFFGILALIAGFASSCSKDDDGEDNNSGNGSSVQKRLVKEIRHSKYGYGDKTTVFEYDNSGRCIAEIENGEKTLYTYYDNKIISDDGYLIFTINANGLWESSEHGHGKHTFTYDNQGHLISEYSELEYEEGENTTYKWENGNVTQEIGSTTTLTYKYTNDVYTSPIENKAGFFLSEIDPITSRYQGILCKNLPVTLIREDSGYSEMNRTYSFVWTLDEDGYPIKCTSDRYDHDYEWVWE